MTQESLTREISGLSLDQTVQQHMPKKSRRPNRAYHNLASGVSLPTTPLTDQDGFSFNQSNQSFSPMQFQHGSTSAPRLAAESPARVAQEQYTPSFSRSVSNSTPTQNASHIVPTQRWENQLQYLRRTYETARDSVPPLPTTQYYCADQGSCDPRLMSLSMYNIPVDEHLRSATKLPLGLTIQPFAKLIPEEPIPIVSSLHDQGPLRCRRCRAYINPAFELAYDSCAICNICKVKTPIPPEDFPPLGVNPQESLNNAKPELMKGCVEFLVPEIYNAIKDTSSLPLHYVFLIDLSLLANENGSSLAVVEGVRTCIEYIADFQPNCKVAIMAFDSKVKFFNLSPSLTSAKEYVLTDINDVFLPIFNGLFAKPQESMKVINDTLRKITDYIVTEKFSHVAHVCYGSALQAAKLALDTITGGQGGKIVCSLNSLPSIGNGNLSLRKDDAIKRNLKCDNDFYTKLGHGFLRSYISLDLYVTTAAFVDMVTIGYPVEVTSGKIRYYPSFTHDKDEFTLVNDMLQNVSNIVGYQALLKIRCSSGLSVCQYYLESAENSERDPMFPVLTMDTTLDVLLKYDQKLQHGATVSFQAALLYTDVDGNRKVRSINRRAPVSSNIREVFQSIDQNVAMRIMIKDVVASLGACDFISIRKTIDTKMVEILTQYRALVGGNLTSQLVLPDALKTLPAYMLSFQKSELMAPNGHSSRGNDRIYDLFTYKTMSSAQLSYKLYPQIVPLHVVLDENDLTFYDANDKLLQISPGSIENLTVRNAHSNITNGGCYLIFQGDTVYLWFNENTNRMLLQDLMQVDAATPISQISLFSGSLPEMETQVNKKATDLIKNWCQITNTASLTVELLRPNVDQYYSRVMGRIFCEDKTVNNIEAGDNYLVTLHRLIQEKFKKDDYVKVNVSAPSVTNNNHDQENFHQKFVQF